MKKVGFYGGKFLPIHNGHVYCATLASTMVDELHIIVSYDTEFEKEVLFKDAKMKHVGFEKRVRWWKQITKHMDNVFVHSIYETNDNKFESWQKGAEQIKECVGKDITHVFSSEVSYGEYFDKLYPEAEHVVIDEKRSAFHISATKLRKHGAFEHWDMLPKVVQKHFVKKIAIIGTESTGKSTLVKNLANVFSTNSVEEYGRTFYEDMGSYETFIEDYPKIAFKQKVLEEEATNQSNKVLFVDTEASVTMRFLEHYHEEELKSPADEEHYRRICKMLYSMTHAQDFDYDLIVVLKPDVKWVDDGTRNLGEEDIRIKGHKHLVGILNSLRIEHIEVEGNYLERFLKVSKLVNEIME